ncbi:hypothetical protein GCM10023085_06200 [Actinomadura viridis]|uniref:DUF397 domain-containing protein n=1 Tax=Actinomadura viridis TaxID=58110 RepID=UPI0018CA4F14|nr:DUF397 domain-containing protein [Actinomadura viridis]
MSQWRKSTHSQGGGHGECVEVAPITPGTTLIRDSRDPSGPRLRLTRSEFTKFISKLKARDQPAL